MAGVVAERCSGAGSFLGDERAKAAVRDVISSGLEQAFYNRQLVETLLDRAS